MNLDDARRRNQTLVREQRVRLERKAVSRGIARVTLYVSQMKTPPDDDALKGHVDAAEKSLRKLLVADGYLVNRVLAVRLLNGDVELRAEVEKRETRH